MSVLLEMSLGDVVVDLFVDIAPTSCKNFLKLCKIKYYNYSPIYNVQKDFSFQSGDPLGPDSPESNGGSSIWGLTQGDGQRLFAPDFNPTLTHRERGVVSMATALQTSDSEQRVAGSQFIITLGENVDFLDGKASVFGRVVEGFDVLDRINETFVDENGRPLKDIRLRHTIILDDPYDDPKGLIIPVSSPLPSKAQLATVRIADDEEMDEEINEEALARLKQEREARAQALTLEMVGDLPFAEVKPPENVLFVCKLNPVTQAEDLDLIFSRFGKVLSCEVIRDKRTGDSLQYAFVEFEDQKACEQAYFKMQDVLIDDHRIHVDFSQSVSKLADTWRTALESTRARKTHGFGGSKSLEGKRHFRASGIQAPRGRKYDMIFEEHAPNPKRTRETSKGPSSEPGSYFRGRQKDTPSRRRSRSPAR